MSGEKLDLSEISTSDLLNEAFRRGAILRVDYNFMMDTASAADENYRDFSKAQNTSELMQCAMKRLQATNSIKHIFKNTADGIKLTTETYVCLHPEVLRNGA